MKITQIPLSTIEPIPTSELKPLHCYKLVMDGKVSHDIIYMAVGERPNPNVKNVLVVWKHPDHQSGDQVGAQSRAYDANRWVEVEAELILKG